MCSKTCGVITRIFVLMSTSSWWGDAHSVKADTDATLYGSPCDVRGHVVSVYVAILGGERSRQLVLTSL